ncbi:MAG TPA: tyrosine-type recombinase/integrase [Bacteroidales bacterium]|nr:tyrosine-type recombinase/integrase [Bacteroidales bacterium]
MKPKVLLKRITHRGMPRIAMSFVYDEVVKARVKSVPGSTYSKTNRCFYVDDTEENLKMILRELSDYVDVDISLIAKKEEGPVDIGSEILMTDQGPGSSESSGDIFYPEEEETFPRTVTRVSFESGKVEITGGKRYGPVELRISDREGLLVVKFMGLYDPGWIKELRTYGWCRYDKLRKEWLLPWKKLTCDSLADYFSSLGIEVRVKKNQVDEKLHEERKSTGEVVRERVLSGKALDGLDSLRMYLEENRYSTRTIESYMAMLGFFFRYFNEVDPVEISGEEINRFLHDFIIRLGYSASYQNQMISAIKTYYNITGVDRFDAEGISRPRRRRALPKVFSKEEVSIILNASGNIKHKLLLWIIYSCGLRRSEVTNIRLRDLDRDRGIIHIREGKGMVDRIVPVSEKVWGKIDEYIRSYSPREYLFEGQSGGRYSSESVYRVFKCALRRAGINKDVGVHSLRHSYATHLHENGLDIRYIQELLGHRSTKTTEIYTHVSRRNLIQVRSPIDDLDVK